MEKFFGFSVFLGAFSIFSVWTSKNVIYLKITSPIKIANQKKGEKTSVDLEI